MKNKEINADRLILINIAEDICNIIHRQIHILSGLQRMYQVALDLARSFNDERIEIRRGENDEK